MKAMCMKCRQKDKNNAMKEMKDAEITMTARGGYMAKGKCSDCDCGMCKILSKDNAEKAVADGEAKKAY